MVVKGRVMSGKILNIFGKTVSVMVERLVEIKKYKKRVKSSKKYLVHNLFPEGAIEIGDNVDIRDMGRRFSKRKSHYIERAFNKSNELKIEINSELRKELNKV